METESGSGSRSVGTAFESSCSVSSVTRQTLPAVFDLRVGLERGRSQQADAALSRGRHARRVVCHSSPARVVGRPVASTGNWTLAAVAGVRLLSRPATHGPPSKVTRLPESSRARARVRPSAVGVFVHAVRIDGQRSCVSDKSGPEESEVGRSVGGTIGADGGRGGCSSGPSRAGRRS